MSPTSKSVKDLGDANRFQLLVEGVIDYALYMLDPDGFVVSWNSGAEKLKGYAAYEIIGQHFSRFFTKEDRAAGLPEAILAKAKQTGRCESEGYRVRKDGSRFWANAVTDAIRDEDGQLIGFAKITRDITERVAAQQALIETERRFRLLVDSVTDHAIYMLDPSGRVVHWNAGAERMKGYSADEIIGQHFSRFYTREERLSGVPLRVLETAARDGQYQTEGWRVRKDGGRFWASVSVHAIRDGSGELLGFAKVTRDMTERNKAQEALRESERQLRLLIRGVTDYALYMLDPNGIVTSWNAGAERIKGYTADEILGQHFSRFYTDHERSAGLPARVLQIAAKEGRYESEGWRVRKDGTMFWANAVIDAIHDERGNVIGFAKITRDITEKREAQLALQKAEEQRAHAQKMEALGQLTGGIAHDFNNLLMIVSGYIQTLKVATANDPKTARAAEAIETAAKRGEALTRQLLSFSRRQVLEPVVVSFADRLDAVRPMLASALGPSIKLLEAMPSDLWPVRLDVNELELTLINIFLNARDAMPNGGIITVSAENVTLRPNEIAGLSGEFVAVTVADTGSGIAQDILPRVFDPFFTTKSPTKGSGLGLSQVYGFAHQSGGTVAIKSELGKGTAITLYFPRAQESAKPQEETKIEEVGGGAALLVEDNPEVAAATAELLQQLGYTVATTADAQTALEMFEPGKFDLVVSDMVMAGSMNGLDLGRALRKQDPRLPIILVTGYSDAAEMGRHEFIVLRKPYQLADLSRATAKLLAEARQTTPSNIVPLPQSRLTGKSRQ